MYGAMTVLQAASVCQIQFLLDRPLTGIRDQPYGQHGKHVGDLSKNNDLEKNRLFRSLMKYRTVSEVMK